MLFLRFMKEKSMAIVTTLLVVFNSHEFRQNAGHELIVAYKA